MRSYLTCVAVLCCVGLTAHAQPRRKLPAPVHPDTLPTLRMAWDLPASLAPRVKNTYAPRMTLDPDEEYLYVFDHHGWRLAKVRARTGKVKWHVPVPSKTSDTFAFTPLIHAGRVFVATFGYLYSFDAKTGRKRWRTPVRFKGAPVNGLAQSRNRLYLPYVQVDKGRTAASVNLYAIDFRTARPLWSKRFPGHMAYVEADEGTVYFVGSMGNVLGLTPSRGDYKWQVRLKGRVRNRPILKKKMLYVRTDLRKAGWKGTGIYAIDAARGKLVWKKKLGSTVNSMFLYGKDNHLAMVRGDGILEGFDGAGNSAFTIDLNFVDQPSSLEGVSVGKRAYIFSSHQDGNGFVRLVDLESRKMVIAANALDMPIRSMIPSVKKRIFLDGRDGNIYAYRLASRPPKRGSVPPAEYAREMLTRIADAEKPVVGLAPKLAGLGNKALPEIELALQSDNPCVVQVAARAIALLRNQRSMRALVRVAGKLQGTVPGEKYSIDPLMPVLRAIAALRGGQAVGVLTSIMQDPNQVHHRRRAAYVALGAIGTPAALNPIYRHRAANQVGTTSYKPQTFTPELVYDVEQDVKDPTQWPEEVKKQTGKIIQTKDGKTYTASISGFLGGYNDIWIGESDLTGAMFKPVFTGLTMPEVERGRTIQIRKVRILKGGKQARIAIRIRRGKKGWVRAKPVTISLEQLQADMDKDGLPDRVERRLHLCLTHKDSDGDGINDAEDLNPLAARRKPAKLTREQQLYQEAFFTYFSFLKRRGIVVVDPGDLPSFELYGRKDPVISLRRPTIEQFRKEVGMHSTDYVSFGGPYPEGGGAGDALREVQWNRRKTQAIIGMDLFRSGNNAAAYNVTLKKVRRGWVVTRMNRVWTTNE